MSGERTFDAWSFPRSATPGGEPAASFDAGGLRVRYPGTDPEGLRSLTRSLRGAASGLRKRPARDLAALLGKVGARFLDPEDPLRARALACLPPTSGLSAEMAAAVLDGMAADWTPEGLERTLISDFPRVAVLDSFVEIPGGRLRAMGPDLCVQVVAGSVPGVGATALLRSLLVKAPTLVKPGKGDVVLPVLLADALREEDPELGESLAVVYWPGGNRDLEVAALESADVVTAYGGDDAVRSLRDRTPVTARFLAYHHRVSVGVVGRGGLDAQHWPRVAAEVAGAVAFFDQRGCVSPHLVYVEEGGALSAAQFARHVASALEVVERHLPGGVLDAEEGSALHQARGSAELMAAAGSGVEVQHGETASWTVVLDPRAALDLLCVGRVVRVRPVASALSVPSLLAPFRGHLQTVALAGIGEESEALAEALARVGATRITSFDAMPFPPPGWHHDGRGALEDLVRWVGLET